jgi:hypothetical protein
MPSKIQTEEASNKKKYFAKREEITEIRSNETLLKWKVLSSANKLGRKIWGKEFTVKRLASDMDLPVTTTKRCLSLDKATEKSWVKVKNKEISAFKLAMVCLLKDNRFHDKIVNAVISQNLSTTQIKSFKPKNIQDVTKWKHKKAVEQGYAKEETAKKALKNWIDRGKVFMLMPISSVGKNSREEMMEELKLLHLKLGRYINNDGKTVQ